jgi:aminocarboxymuconate-semialdehyde decarboxylase
VTEILDVWAHVVPERYFRRIDPLLDASPRIRGQGGWLQYFTALYDLEARRRLLDGLDDYRQILVLAIPPIEELGEPELRAELARLANDELAELVRSDPQSFAGFAAALPLNDVGASVLELERSIRELGALGALVYTPIAGQPLDDPRFEPLFATLAERGGAVWLHPTRGRVTPDYESEPASKFGLWFALGWPNETTVAIARLVFSGIVARYPQLPIIAHHGGGGMIHQFPHRIVELAMLELEGVTEQTEPDLIRQLRSFYADTFVESDAGLRSSFDFFGVDHMLFGTDMPFGAPTMVADRVAQVHRLGLTEEETRAVLAGNARRVLGLD